MTPNFVSDLNSLSDVTISAPAANELLKFNGTNWVNSSDYLSMRQLNDLGDVNISGPSDAQLLTFQNISSQWVNQNKPTYSIQEQTDFNSSATKNDLDYMAWNASTSKWEPITVDAEVVNYLRIIQTADAISINTTVDAGFNKFNILNTALANHSVVNVGTAFTILNNYTLRVNDTGYYEFGISATSENGNMNFTLV